jgi:O-antigen ligase
MFTESPIIGKGAAYVGPGSHRDGGLAFNPENQYLQILIEFGIIGFLLWMPMYIWLNRV